MKRREYWHLLAVRRWLRRLKGVAPDTSRILVGLGTLHPAAPTTETSPFER